MIRACVIGWPIAHSRSPIIHGYWIKKYGIDGAYTRLPVKPDEVETFLRDLSASGFAGCNVTVPHKEAAFAAAEQRDESAVAVGAANTLWIEDGKLLAANTDTYGFMANLDASAPDWRQNAVSVLVLGAGGSARAVVYGFIAAGIETIYVCNRSLERAEELAEHFGSHVVARSWDERSRLATDVSLIANTTTLGMNGVDDPGIDFTTVREGTIVADLVYVPLETSFLAAARRRGLVAVDGLGMLLHQAVPGFEKWFKVRPEVTRELYEIVAQDIGGK